MTAGKVPRRAGSGQNVGVTCGGRWRGSPELAYTVITDIGYWNHGKEAYHAGFGFQCRRHFLHPFFLLSILISQSIDPRRDEQM
jgi:hypothetical protein